MYHETIEIGPNYHGLLVSPDQPGTQSLLLIHEIFGINPYIRSLAEEYAARGYTVLVPDLFWRAAPGIELDPSVPEQRDRAVELNKSYDDALGMQDLAEAVRVLRAAAPQGKVAAVGYCLGGRLAFRLAAQRTVDAAVAYYGVNIHKLLDGATAPSPLLVHVAGADYLCPPEAQQAISASLAPLPQVTVLRYAGAGHGFARPNSQHYLAPAANAADTATTAFLARWLQDEAADA